MTKSVITKFAFASIYILFIVLLISGVSVKYASSKPTDGNVCDSLTGAAYGLCNAYCNAMDCANPNHKASDRACERVKNNFFKHSDLRYIPCDDPCQEEVRNNPENECPCDFENVPKTTDCWPIDYQPTTFGPCSTSGCIGTSMSEDQCTLTYLDQGEPYGLTVGSSGAVNPPQYVCQSTTPGGTGACLIAPIFFSNSDQYATCLCRVAQYANELSQVDDGIVVNPALQSGMSYSCEPQ